jgi:hypothetical protein
VIQIRTGNFTRKVIGEICKAFFYRPNKLASLFPEEFKDEVPMRAVAFVITIVSLLHLAFNVSHCQFRFTAT